MPIFRAGLLLSLVLCADSLPGAVKASSCSDPDLQAEIEEELRAASDRGVAYLEAKRAFDAQASAMMGSSMLQTATRTQNAVLQELAPNARLMKRTITPFEASDG